MLYKGFEDYAHGLPKQRKFEGELRIESNSQLIFFTCLNFTEILNIKLSGSELLNVTSPFQKRMMCRGLILKAVSIPTCYNIFLLQSLSKNMQMEMNDVCKKQEPVTNIKQEQQQIEPKKLKIPDNWTLEENQKYALFLYQNQGLFRCQRTRRSFKVFKLISHMIRSRTNKQCKSHHQKMLKRHRNNNRIITSILGNIPEVPIAPVAPVMPQPMDIKCEPTMGYFTYPIPKIQWQWTFEQVKTE